MAKEFKLEQDARGRLQLTLADGTLHEGVITARAFPLSAPDEFIALVSSDGRELVSVPRLSALAEPERGIIIGQLTAREFVPRIEAIESCSAFATPSTWTVLTDRGRTQLILKAEEDIRRLEGGRLMITDSHGLQFEVVERSKLDTNSRRILMRFL